MLPRLAAARHLPYQRNRYLRRSLLEQPDLAFQQRPFVPVNLAPDPIVRLAVDQREKSHDNIGTVRDGSLRPAKRHHDCLTNPEAVSRHDTYLGWHRIEGNQGSRLPLGIRLSRNPRVTPNRRALHDDRARAVEISDKMLGRQLLRMPEFRPSKFRGKASAWRKPSRSAGVSWPGSSVMVAR